MDPLCNSCLSLLRGAQKQSSGNATIKMLDGGLMLISSLVRKRRDPKRA